MWARLRSLCKRLWSGVTPQVQTPLKVRLQYGLPILALYIFYYLHVPLQNKFAIYGVISAVLGAGVLFGESIVSNRTCLRMAEDLKNYRSSRISLLIWVPLALVAVVAAWAAYFVYTYDRDVAYEEYWETAYALALILAPALLLYYLTAVPIDSFFRWVARRLATPASGVIPRLKRGLRATGFALLAVGGALQLPALLWPPS
jgi:hypothetical protein